MSGARPLAVIFDCDGVLVDSEGLASRVESEVGRDLGLTLGVEEAHDLFIGKTVDGVLDAIAARTPVRRAGTPDDIAAACAFLCSDDAIYITGQIIGVNGGWVI